MRVRTGGMGLLTSSVSPAAVIERPEWASAFKLLPPRLRRLPGVLERLLRHLRCAHVQCLLRGSTGGSTGQSEMAAAVELQEATFMCMQLCRRNRPMPHCRCWCRLFEPPPLVQSAPPSTQQAQQQRSKPSTHVDQDLAGLVAERLVLLQLAARLHRSGSRREAGGQQEHSAQQQGSLLARTGMSRHRRNGQGRGCCCTCSKPGRIGRVSCRVPLLAARDGKASADLEIKMRMNSGGQSKLHCAGWVLWACRRSGKAPVEQASPGS